MRARDSGSDVDGGLVQDDVEQVVTIRSNRAHASCLHAERLEVLFGHPEFWERRENAFVNHQVSVASGNINACSLRLKLEIVEGVTAAELERGLLGRSSSGVDDRPTGQHAEHVESHLGELKAH